MKTGKTTKLITHNLNSSHITNFTTEIQND
jgi:hypothetical protein